MIFFDFSHPSVVDEVECVVAINYRMLEYLILISFMDTTRVKWFKLNNVNS